MAHGLTHSHARPRRVSRDHSTLIAVIAILAVILGAALLQPEEPAAGPAADIWRGNSADLQAIDRAPATVVRP